MNYKTIFVDSPLVKQKGVFASGIEDVNTDQLAREMDAAIAEKEKEGYELFSTTPIAASKILMGAYPYSYTSGIMLVFKKKDA